MLEDTAVAAYNGQAANHETKPTLKAAATIVSVEARHAAWIRDIVGEAGTAAGHRYPGHRTPGAARDCADGLREGGRMIPERPADLGLSLDQLDRDGALREAASRLPRGRFLAAAAGAAAVFRVAASPARAALPEGTSRFSTTRSRSSTFRRPSTPRPSAWGRSPGEAAEAVEVVGAVERAHVEAFRDLLGAKAVKRPTFDFKA